MKFIHERVTYEMHTPDVIKFSIDGVEFHFNPVLEHLYKDENGVRWYWFEGYWNRESDVCRHCLDERAPQQAETQYSMGIYAGKYCDECWEVSGYRKDADFDPTDAGEHLNECDY